jgi:hypothetical protein
MKELKRSFADLVESFGHPQDASPVELKPGDQRGHLRLIRRDGPSGGSLEWLCHCRLCGCDIRVSGSYLRAAGDYCTWGWA